MSAAEVSSFGTCCTAALLAVVLIGGVRASADSTREAVANTKYVCSDKTNLEIWLWFSKDARNVVRTWGKRERLKVTWDGDRAVIPGRGGSSDLSYFERRDGYAYYAGLRCSEVDELPNDGTR